MKKNSIFFLFIIIFCGATLTAQSRDFSYLLNGEMLKFSLQDDWLPSKEERRLQPRSIYGKTTTTLFFYYEFAPACIFITSLNLPSDIATSAFHLKLHRIGFELSMRFRAKKFTQLKETSILGVPCYVYSYGMKYKDKKYFESRLYYFVKNEKLYLITYLAEKPDFAQYLPHFKELLDTLTIDKQTQ